MARDVWVRRQYVVLAGIKGVYIKDMFASKLYKLRRCVFTWQKVIEDYLQNNDIRIVGIGLSYANMDNWQPCNIRNYIWSLRQKIGDGLISYIWVAELQKRLTLHYHVGLIVKKGTDIPIPDSSGMWIFGTSNIKTVPNVFYLVEHSAKGGYQKDYSKFPKGARCYGYSFCGNKIMNTMYKEYIGLEDNKKNDSEGMVYAGSSILKKTAELMKKTEERYLGLDKNV